MIRTTHTGPGERIATVTGDNVGSGVRMPGVAERFISLNEYTGLKASRCSGGPATADMVVEYLLDLTTQKWTVAAREWSQRDIVMVRPLEMLRVPASATSGETRVVGNRTARAIGAPWPRRPRREFFSPAIRRQIRPNLRRCSRCGSIRFRCDLSGGRFRSVRRSSTGSTLSMNLSCCDVLMGSALLGASHSDGTTTRRHPARRHQSSFQFSVDSYQFEVLETTDN